MAIERCTQDSWCCIQYSPFPVRRISEKIQRPQLGNGGCALTAALPEERNAEEVHALLERLIRSAGYDDEDFQAMDTRLTAMRAEMCGSCLTLC
jgi:hypothetical protein